MNLNIVVLSGTIAAEPEVRRFPSGSTLIRYLITVRSEAPRRRVDVIPVTLWDPPAVSLDALDGPPIRGRSVWAVGSAQRRFWSSDGARTSRIEVVAHIVELREAEDAEESETHASA